MCWGISLIGNTETRIQFHTIMKISYFYNVCGIGLIKMDKSYQKDVILKKPKYC